MIKDSNPVIVGKLLAVSKILDSITIERRHNVCLRLIKQATTELLFDIDETLQDYKANDNLTIKDNRMDFKGPISPDETE